MSYALLERLAQLPLPAAVVDRDEIDLLRGYVAAGLVTADIPPPQRLRTSTEQPSARVLAMTPAGHREVRRQSKPGKPRRS